MAARRGQLPEFAEWARTDDKQSFTITVDGDQPQTVTFTAGPNTPLADIAAALNAQLVGVTAEVNAREGDTITLSLHSHGNVTVEPAAPTRPTWQSEPGWQEQARGRRVRAYARR